MATKKKNSSEPINTGDLITQAEAAKLRGVTISSINGLVQRGRLRSEEVFGRTLVYRAEVLTFEPLKPGRKPSDGAEQQ